jgi:hypothetical protein
MKNVIQNLYEDTNLGDIVVPDCQGCSELERRLIKSEFNNVNLMLENQKLKLSFN